jgi:general secretion pathway protein G
MFCPKCGKEVSEGAQFCQHCGTNLQVSEPGVKPKRSPAVIVLIIVGVIFGFIILSIIAAIAIPSLLSAKQRSNQKQTMGDLRSIGTAVDLYSIDCKTYPICNDIDELAELLQPNYMRIVPKLDGWGNPFKYEVKNDGKDYCLISRGKDGVQDVFFQDPLDIYSLVPQAFDGFDHDIVFCDGQFIYWPQ